MLSALAKNLQIIFKLATIICVLSTVQGLQQKLSNLYKVGDPLKRTFELVEVAMDNFAWGQKPVEAIIGDPSKRITGNGGSKSEIDEVKAEAHKLHAAKTSRPKNETSRIKRDLAKELADIITMSIAWAKKLGIKTELQKKLANNPRPVNPEDPESAIRNLVNRAETQRKEGKINNIAKIIKTTMKWAQDLGLTQKELERGLKDNCTKLSKRFRHALNFVTNHRVNLQDLKDPEIFDTIWCAVKKHGRRAWEHCDPRQKQLAL